MADKVKSCPYCHEDNDGYVKMFGRFYLRKDHFNGWNLYAGKGKPLPIKFCPICVRLLEIKQTQVYSIQDDFCGVPCKFMEDKINSLQTENVDLKTENLILSQKRFNIFERVEFSAKVKEKAKAEAYKEFAEELNNKAMFPHEIKDDYAVGLETIYNLFKELVGEDK